MTEHTYQSGVAAVSETEETYLGDGLYASFNGWQIKLRAPRWLGGDHEVLLEAVVWDQLQAFVRKATQPDAGGTP